MAVVSGHGESIIERWVIKPVIVVAVIFALLMLVPGGPKPAMLVGGLAMFGKGLGYTTKQGIPAVADGFASVPEYKKKADKKKADGGDAATGGGVKP